MDALLFEKHVKKITILSSIISMVIGVSTAITIGYGFYYNTTNTLDDHTVDIHEIQKDVSDVKEQINQIDVFKGVSTVEIEALENKVDKVERTVDKMDDKLDEILTQIK